MTFINWTLISNLAMRFNNRNVAIKTTRIYFGHNRQLFSHQNDSRRWFLEVIANELCTSNIFLMEFEFPQEELNKLKKRNDVIDPATLSLTPNPIVKGQSITNKVNKYIAPITSSKRKPYSKSEDELIIEYVNTYGYNDQTFENVAFEINRPRGKFVKERYDRLMAKEGKKLPPFQKIKTHTKKKFFAEEDNIIKEYVINYGYSMETFKKLTTVLNRPRWEAIRSRYEIIMNKVDVHEDKNKKLNEIRIISRKNFTKEEDIVIVDFVNQFGYNYETFETLASELGRSHPYSIRMRHDRLTSKIPIVPRNNQEWSFEEDLALIRFMIKVAPIRFKIKSLFFYFIMILIALIM